MNERAISRRPFSETIVLAALALADTISTLWLIGAGLAVEANPIMAYYLRHGAGWFILAKLVFLSPAFIVDWNKWRDPDLARWGLRLAISIYVGIYALGTLAQALKILLR